MVESTVVRGALAKVVELTTLCMAEVRPSSQVRTGAWSVAVAFDVRSADGVGAVVLDDVFVVVGILFGQVAVFGCLSSRDSLGNMMSLSHNLGTRDLWE